MTGYRPKLTIHARGRRSDDKSAFLGRLRLLPADIAARVDRNMEKYDLARMRHRKNCNPETRRQLAVTRIAFHRACDAAIAWASTGGIHGDGPAPAAAPSCGHGDDNIVQGAEHEAGRDV
jgi:hypothetical protein